MDWGRDGRHWPNHEMSRFIDCRPHRWHVQEAGRGPLVLLLHGAGASTHSWRALIPDLARDHHVVAVDLPGQGFSRAGSRLGLGIDAMAGDLAALLADQGWHPDAIVGHSAGGALALRLVRELPDPPATVVCINGALANFQGVAGWLFPMLAKMLAMNPLAGFLLSRTAGNAQSVRNLLQSTGSRVDDEGVRLYRALIGNRRHVEGVLAMMAQWKLDPLLADLPGIDLPVLFLTGGRDTAVPPETSVTAAVRMARAEVRRFDDLGHLMHEEAPEVVSGALREWFARHLKMAA